MPPTPPRRPSPTPTPTPLLPDPGSDEPEPAPSASPTPTPGPSPESSPTPRPPIPPIPLPVDPATVVATGLGDVTGDRLVDLLLLQRGGSRTCSRSPWRSPSRTGPTASRSCGGRARRRLSACRAGRRRRSRLPISMATDGPTRRSSRGCRRGAARRRPPRSPSPRARWPSSTLSSSDGELLQGPRGVDARGRGRQGSFRPGRRRHR